MCWSEGSSRGYTGWMTVACGHRGLSCRLVCIRNHQPHAPLENPSSALTHTYTTHSISTLAGLCLFHAQKCKQSYSHMHAYKHPCTESFIILLLAAVSISCALSAPSTAVPKGQASPPPRGRVHLSPPHPSLL